MSTLVIDNRECRTHSSCDAHCAAIGQPWLYTGAHTNARGITAPRQKLYSAIRPRVIVRRAVRRGSAKCGKCANPRSGGASRRRRVDPVEVAVVVGVFGRAELALYRDAPGLVAQVVELLALDRTQHAVDALAAAAAARDEGPAGEQARLLGVEQAVKQGHRRQLRIEHFGLGR